MQLPRTLTRSKLLDAVPNLQHGFTAKDTPEADRAAIDAATSTVKQVHGDRLAWTERLEHREREADALGTFTPGLPVGASSADCVPVLLAAQDLSTNRVYAVVAAHAGWRGTAQGIAGKCLRELVRECRGRSSPATRFLAVIGPCISCQAFEVHEDVLQAFPGAEARGLARRVDDENGRKKYLVDLAGENLRQLREAAAAEKAELVTEHLALCTVQLVDRFPSYRRDRQVGRILSFLAFR